MIGAGGERILLITMNGGSAMDFRISGLDGTEFAPLFGLSDEQLRERDIVRCVADRMPYYPCRVSLQDAKPGEHLLLLNYEHLAVASPFRSRHAIYVRENAQAAAPGVNEIPSMLRTRLLSLRAFDNDGMMVQADVAQGSEVEPLIQRMLEQPNVEFIHAHNAKQGCFAARIDRA
jgi:hypothetical protein